MNVCTYVYTDGRLYIVLKNNRHTEGTWKTKLVLRNNLMRLEDCGDIMKGKILAISAEDWRIVMVDKSKARKKERRWLNCSNGKLKQ